MYLQKQVGNKEPPFALCLWHTSRLPPLFYFVIPKVFVQAVKRNIDRFPEDFMFQLTDKEFNNLKSQIVISSWGGMRRAKQKQMGWIDF